MTKGVKGYAFHETFGIGIVNFCPTTRPYPPVFPTPKYPTRADLKEHIRGCLYDRLLTENECIDLWSSYVLHFDDELQQRSVTKAEFYEEVFGIISDVEFTQFSVVKNPVNLDTISK